jgi:hypothetical protein
MCVYVHLMYVFSRGHACVCVSVREREYMYV